MVRRKLLRHNVWLRLSQVERAVVGHYAERYNRDVTSIIRGMIKQYVRADVAFDVERFRQYVRDKVTPTVQDDQAMKAELDQQVEDFVTGIRAARE